MQFYCNDTKASLNLPEVFIPLKMSSKNPQTVFDVRWDLVGLYRDGVGLPDFIT